MQNIDREKRYILQGGNKMMEYQIAELLDSTFHGFIIMKKLSELHWELVKKERERSIKEKKEG